MDNPFDTDMTDEADLFASEAADGSLDAGEDSFAGDDAFGESTEAGDAFAFDGADSALDAFSLDGMGDSMTDGSEADSAEGDMALWDVFEEEVADGLDAADDDEFLGRVLGGLGRAAGVVGRGLGQASTVAGQVGGFTQQAGRAAQQAGQIAGRVTPAAIAAARLARMLGAPGVAGALGQVGRLSRGAQAAARRTGQLSAAVGQASGGAQSLFRQLSQLLAGIAQQGFDDADAFDTATDWFVEDGLDEALPAAVALAARGVARGLGFQSIQQLSLAARRSLVRGVAAAARELIQRGGPAAIRALPQLGASAARVAARRAPGTPKTVQALRRGLPQAARRLAQNPQAIGRLARPGPRAGNARNPSPLARSRNLGRGRPETRISGQRTFEIDGPVTLTITPR